jgi:hypothetical protein
MAFARFTSEEKKRTAEAVIQYERMNTGAPEPTDRAKGYYPRAFWARITGSDGSGYYSWEALKPDEDGYITEDPDEDYPTGSHSDEEYWAVEATGSKWVLTDDIVWMRGAETNPYYVFDYSPGVKMATFTGTIPKGTATAPGKSTATTKNFDGTSYTAGQSVDIHNPWYMDLDSTNTPASLIQLSFGEGVWWVSGANCQEEE